MKRILFIAMLMMATLTISAQSNRTVETQKDRTDMLPEAAKREVLATTAQQRLIKTATDISLERQRPNKYKT